jgi:outer membrane protein
MIRVLFSILLLNSILAAQVTLNDCIRSGLQNNPALLIIENEARSSAEDLKQAQNSRLPSVDFSGSYRHQSNVPELNIPPIDTPFGSSITLFPNGGMTLGLYDTYDFRLTLSQPLFTGFRLSQRATAASEMLYSKRLEVQKNRNELAFKIESAYGNVLKAYNLASIMRTSRDQIKSHLKDVDNMLSQGLVRKDDQLRTQVKLSEAELAVLHAENSIRLARTVLENSIGETLSPTDSLAAMTIEPVKADDLDATIEQALAQRPELQMLAYNERAGHAAVKIMRGARLPTVAAFGSVGYGKPGLDIIQKEWMDYWLVGAGVEWNLWDWGNTRSQEQQARIRLETIVETTLQVRQAVTLDVTEAFLRLQEAQQTLQLMSETEGQAAESYRISENSYRQGQATHTDFFDAQSQWVRVLLQQEQAEIDVAVARANLRRALGIPSLQQ